MAPPTRPDQPHRPNDDVEVLASRVERLSRARPEIFTNRWSEIAFVYSVLASQMIAEYFVSGFNVLLPSLVRDLSIPQASVVWPSGAFALVTAAFLLPCGRLADIYGGFVVYISGLTWFIIWSCIAGFSTSSIMLDICRALQGLGPAAYLPSGVMLLGSIYRPGPRKNLIFALYGGAAPLGFYAGIFFAGLTGNYLRFGWYFWFGTFLSVSTLIPAYLTIPSDSKARRAMNIAMDVKGSVTIVVGLILLIFAVTQASHASSGWRTPYIIVTLILGSLTLALAVFIQVRVAKNPLLPPDVFRLPHLSALFVALFFSYGVLGTFLLYATLYMQDIMGATPLQVTAWYTPMCLGGIIISITGGFVLHLISGTILVVIASLAWCATSLLFALAPDGANYWAFVFPAMIAATIGIDIIFNVANVFISTSLSLERQGLAGALISSILYLGIAFCLVFADVVQTQVGNHYFGRKNALKLSYQAVFWYQLALAGAAALIFGMFVRIPKATSQPVSADGLEHEKDSIEENMRRLEAHSQSERGPIDDPGG